MCRSVVQLARVLANETQHLDRDEATTGSGRGGRNAPRSTISARIDVLFPPGVSNEPMMTPKPSIASLSCTCCSRGCLRLSHSRRLAFC